MAALGISSQKSGFTVSQRVLEKQGSGGRRCCNFKSYVQIIAHQLRYNKRIIFVYGLVFLVYGLLYWHRNTTKSEPIIQRQVNMYIVEEHQEVLQYWFEAATAGILNKTGNTIVHFDAHEDLATPKRMDGFPFFTWPETLKDVSKMIQHYDDYITSAITTGLIDHYIWIYPHTNTNLLAPKLETHIWEFGILNKKKRERTMCSCSSLLDHRGLIDVHSKTCSYFTDDSEIPILPKYCSVKRSIIAERSPSDVALASLRRGNWLSKLARPIILDIDEDYFGWERALKALEDVGITTSLADKIDQNILESVCVKYVQNERLADVMMKDYISQFIKVCQLTTPRETCRKDTNSLEKNLDPLIMETFKKHPEIFCVNGSAPNMESLHHFLLVLKSMNTEQLKAVIQLGFCMETSPVSSFFNPSADNFGLCDGAVIPEGTASYHTPTQSELASSLTEFYYIMDHISKLDVKLIGMSRSIRNGFTPRSLANDIESGILTFFERPSSDTGLNARIYYDSNLLEGQKGWGNRYMYR